MNLHQLKSKLFILFRLSCQLVKSEGPKTGVPPTIRIIADLKLSSLTSLNLFRLSCHLVQSEFHPLPASHLIKIFQFWLSPQSILSFLPAGEILWTRNCFICYPHQTKFKPFKLWLASIYSVSPASWWDLRDPELVFHPRPALVQIQTCSMLIYVLVQRHTIGQ